MTVDVNPNEWRVLQLLRAIKSENKGAGHGELHVEVEDGIETFLRPRYSERAPMRKSKTAS